MKKSKICLIKKKDRYSKERRLEPIINRKPQTIERKYYARMARVHPLLDRDVFMEKVHN